MLWKRSRSAPHLAVLVLPFLVASAPMALISQVPTASDFSAAVTAVCGAEPQPYDVDGLLDTDATLSWDATGGKALDRATEWKLACTRAQLATTNAPARTSYLMPLGTSWRHGASMLVARMLDDSIEVRAASLLAALNADPVLAEPAQWTLGYLERAIDAGFNAPIVVRQCSLIAWRIGDSAMVRKCAVAGLASGEDSTFHLLALARLAADEADTAESVADFVAAAAAVGDSSDRADLYWHLRWFLSPVEDSTFEHLPSPELAPWLRELLLVRDVRDGQPAGARVAEYFDRLAFVQANFRMSVLPINRPQIMAGTAIADVPGYEFSVERTTPGSETPALRWREFARWQSQFDDRGVVWMRFGSPQDRWYYTAQPDTNFIHRETWLYTIDGQVLLLSFESETGDGSQDATRLVTGVVGEHFCGLNAYRCVIAGRSATAGSGASPGPSIDRMGISLEELTHLRRADKEAIVQATTHDDNSERTPNHLTVHALFLRLWDPETGRPFALVLWAIRATDLQAAAPAGERDPLLRLKIRTLAATTDARHDTTISGRIRLPSDPAGDAYITGVNAMLAPEGSTAWSVFAYLGSDASGRVFDTHASPLETGTLRLSDLVVGIRGAGTVWHGLPGGIATSPFGTVYRNDPAELYYQVDNRSATDSISTTIALYRLGRGDSEPSVRLEFAGRLPNGITEVRRELSFENLDSGSYRLTVEVSEADGGNRVSRSTVLQVR